MLNLLKYEFLKRRKLLGTMLIIFAFLELGVWLGMKLGRGWYTMSIIFFIVMCVGALTFPFIDAVTNYFSDFKKRNGYMLFLTPNSGYKILGAKVLFAVAEVLIFAVLTYVAVSIDYNTLTNLISGEVQAVIGEMTSGMKEVLGVDNITLWTAMPLIAMAFIQYLTEIMLALFAITIAKTLLSQKDFNWLLALAFYIMTYIVVQTVNVAAVAVFGLVKDAINIMEMDSLDLFSIKKYLMLGMVLYAAFFAAAFPISGRLLTKRTDL